MLHSWRRASAGQAAEDFELWRTCDNIALDLVTGANAINATDFAGRARDVIRSDDPQSRPVIASTSEP